MKDVDFGQTAYFLKNLGIKYAFGITGSGSSLRLISALEDQSIPFFSVGHEAAAMMMAGACCQDGKTNALAIGIKGPGFVNFVPGILSNYYEGRPALSISEAYGPSVPSFRKHKRLDHKAICSSIVKAYAKVDGSFESMDLLFKIAQYESPGPIHLDLCNEPVKNNLEDLKGLVSPEPEDGTHNLLAKIVQTIEGFQKPVIILGSLVSRRLSAINWSKLQVPVFTTAAGKGSINEYSPFFAGILTGEIKSLSPEQIILNEADGIIGIGLRNTELVTLKPYGVPLIIIDMVGGELHDGFEVNYKLITRKIEMVASQIFNQLAEKCWGEDIVKFHWKKVEEALLQEDWLPSTIIYQTNRKLNTNSVLVLDTGLFCTVGETLWKVESSSNFCGSSIGRFMGTSIPTAIGAAISNPEKRIVCMMGDGGVRPYLPEMKMAVNEKLPILFVLLSDGLYGTVAVESRKSGLSTRAVDIHNPSWWRAIEAIGCNSQFISNQDELDRVLDNWLSFKQPLFLEMKFDPLKYANLTMNLR
jgi:acetolactate synthase-1/2/3 large subunit